MDIKAIFLGLMVITSYQPIPGQTRAECKDKDHCWTAESDVPTKHGCAVSHDLLQKGLVRYGDILVIEDNGTPFKFRVVNDVMAARHHRSVDLLVFTRSDEHKVGVRKCKVWAIRNTP